jgi:carbon-monoxide dehydrogenase large subunit
VSVTVPTAKFFGARVRRLEDPRFLTGRGRYLDDIVLPGMLHAAFVRSPHARARIEAVDVSRALEMPGVVDVLTGAELAAAGLFLQGPSMYGFRMPILAHDEVRYVGEPVALVVARSRYEAEDAAEAVRVAYRPLPPVVDMEAARRDEERVHAGRSNVFFRKTYATPDIDRVFAEAPVTLTARFRSQRHTAVTLEPRGCIADFDPGTKSSTFYVSTQSPHNVRTTLAELFGWPEHTLRVVAPDVGGGFGMKAAIYPDEVAVLLMSRRLGRPVKWVSDRRESLLADVHARDDLARVEVAADREGHILAVRVHIMADAGAYPAFPYTAATSETAFAAQMMPGPYRIRHFAFTAEAILTNKAPFGAYRGVWGPIASFVQEGIVDRVARALGLDPVEVRRRNMIRRDEFPWRSATGMEYDPGSYLESMEKALAMAGYEAFRERQARLRAEGRLVGIGVSVFVEPTAFAGSEAGDIPYESCLLRVEPSGQVIAFTGLGPSGQGHETTLAQIIADELGIRPEDVIVHHGDTSTAPYGGGTGGSRSGLTGGGAAKAAAVQVKDKIRRIAAHLLEASPDDIVLEDGMVFVAGVKERGLPLREVANAAYMQVGNLPEGVEPGLEALGRYRPAREITFSNGCHVATVEVDPKTGRVTVTGYWVANDCGRVINPTIVEGQIHGGVAQGIGSTFLEHLVYDESGQLLTTTLMDYLLPTATEVPTIEVAHIETPSESFGGVKGMGEGSLIAAPAALAGAVSDALAPYGAFVSELPLTPDRVLGLIEGGQGEHA